MKVSKRKKTSSIIPLSSMADIAFLLLIFFMLSSVAEMEREIPLRLPESRISIRESDKFFNIWINRKGEIFYDNKRDNLDNLVSFARYRASSNPAVKALIRADREIPYEIVNNVLETLKESGVYNIVLVSKKAKK